MKYHKSMYDTTVLAEIEHHSWLEYQGTFFGLTMVIFDEKLFHNYSRYRTNCSKNDHSAEPKRLNFDRTLAFHLHGYGIIFYTNTDP